LVNNLKFTKKKFFLKMHQCVVLLIGQMPMVLALVEMYLAFLILFNFPPFFLLA